ncbi:MAG: hypothetical protein WAW77_04675 [Caldibacillus thermoamylovorans]
MRSVLTKVKKVVSYIIIILSFITGIAATATAEWDDLFINIFLYLLFGGLPFTIGIIMLEGLKEGKENAWGKFRFYTGISFLAPILLKIIVYFNDKNTNRISTPTDIYITNYQDFIGLIIIFTGFYAFCLFIVIYIVGFKVEKELYISLVVAFLISAGLSIYGKNDYYAIREEGLFLSSKEEQIAIPWEDVESVRIEAALVSDIGKYSSKDFEWEFIFYLKEHEPVKFSGFGYDEPSLTYSHQIKNVIMENKISMSIDSISEKEWEFLEVDMEDDEIKPDDFYKLFQYNPETNEYYDINY